LGWTGRSPGLFLFFVILFRQHFFRLLSSPHPLILCNCDWPIGQTGRNVNQNGSVVPTTLLLTRSVDPPRQPTIRIEQPSRCRSMFFTAFLVAVFHGRFRLAFSPQSSVLHPPRLTQTVGTRKTLRMLIWCQKYSHRMDKTVFEVFEV
jgi:hypothetical protein